MPLIVLDDVKKDYALGKTVIHAIRGITLEVGEGDFLSIVGPSGCGKTTLLNMIGCIDQPSEGRILFQGKDLETLSDNAQTEIRLRKIGFIFQSFNLIPVLNIFENIELPLIVARVPRPKRKERVVYLVRAVGLEEFAGHKPDELSGGQRQRVAIARALVNSPDLVMERLNREEKVTFIFSTHNPAVMRFARRVVTLKDGTIVSIENTERAS
jgi:putative ABC transport system ATP-binding protein